MSIHIALSGKMTSGKSLVATHLCKQHGFVELAFAARLKQLAEELFQVKKKDERGRSILQQLAPNLRAIDPNIWLNYIIKQIPEAGNVVISDVRYPNEFERLKGMGFVMVRMWATRKCQEEMVARVYPGVPLELLDDYSETALDGYMYDYTIDNDCPTPLGVVYNQVDNMMRELLNA